jgi:hypothetical protein
MYTSFSTTRRVIPVLTISILLSSMSAMLSASNWNRLDSASTSVDGGTKVSRGLAPPQSRGEAAQPGHVSHSLAKFKSKKGASKLVGTFNIAYDSITNGITAGNGYGNASTIYISEGDIVNFRGKYTAATGSWGNLARTDSYVQIEDPSLHPGADVCGLADSLVAHRYEGNQKNELTGPMRKGVSGIFALGPGDPGEGFYEPAAGQSCSTLALPPGAPAGHSFREVASAIDQAFVTHKLCQLVDTTVSPPVPSSYGSNLLLNSTWDNEDITGAVIRINWKDLQKYDPTTTSVVFDWTRLDAEFNQAARRGKMIFLELLAGDGIPDWVFNDFASTITAGPSDAALVIPITLRDTGSDGTGPGWIRRNASPTDPHYIALVENLIEEVSNHLRNDSRFFQALGSLKVTGTNFMTGEMRLQKNCTDDGSCPNCWCNTEIWQNPLGTPLPAFSGAINNSEATNGGGYTEAGMYAFANSIENKIFQKTQGKKSLIFMLIQAGFPRVRVAGDYWRESTQVGGPVNASGSYSGTIQTDNLLQFGRQGLFATPSGTAPDASVGKLFIPQHAGLQLLPQDQLNDATPDPVDTKPACSQQTTPVFSAAYGKFEAPMPVSGSDNAGGCPNQHAVDESYLGQLTGFQTNNPSEVNTPDHLDSTLWNGTANSKMIFWEAYEQVLWQAAIEKGTGSSALPLSTTNYFSSMGSDYQKNLNYWSNELHRRRTALASAAPTEPNLADPFPTVHTVTFNKNLSPGEIKRYYFINPARCATATGAKYGTIVVTGK